MAHISISRLEQVVRQSQGIGEVLAILDSCGYDYTVRQEEDFNVLEVYTREGFNADVWDEGGLCFEY